MQQLSMQCLTSSQSPHHHTAIFIKPLEPICHSTWCPQLMGRQCLAKIIFKYSCYIDVSDPVGQSLSNYSEEKQATVDINEVRVTKW